MKVYTISRTDTCVGYTTTELDNVKIEFEVELEEFGENPENGFTKDNIPKVLESISKLKVVNDSEVGEAVVRFGPFAITASEMHRWEYDALPEFNGW